MIFSMVFLRQSNSNSLESKNPPLYDNGILIRIYVHLYRMKECVIEYEGDSAVVSKGESRKMETHED